MQRQRPNGKCRAATVRAVLVEMMAAMGGASAKFHNRVAKSRARRDISHRNIGERAPC